MFPAAVGPRHPSPFSIYSPEPRGRRRRRRVQAQALGPAPSVSDITPTNNPLVDSWLFIAGSWLLVAAIPIAKGKKTKGLALGSWLDIAGS